MKKFAHPRPLKFLLRSMAYKEEIARAYYGIACIYSVLGKKRLALQFLEQSLQAGFKDINTIENNSDMKCIRNDYGWLRIKERYSSSRP